MAKPSRLPESQGTARKIELDPPPGEQRADALEQGAVPQCGADGGEIGAEGDKVGTGRPVARAGDQGRLAAEQDLGPSGTDLSSPVERLDPQGVAGQEQAAAIDPRQGEHAA
jgi:hypothetical protein